MNGPRKNVRLPPGLALDGTEKPSALSRVVITAPSQGRRDESALKKREDMATNEESVYYGQCGWAAGSGEVW